MGASAEAIAHNEMVEAERAKKRKLEQAAPAMLKALIETRQIVGHNHWDETQRAGEGYPLCIRQREIMARVEAAIAAAT